jgi:3-dehydroquinate dehydratase-1
MSNRICVSLQPQSTEDLRRLVSRAKEYNPGLIEIRLDFLETISVEGIKEVLSPDSGQYILTCRPRGKGGFYKGDEKKCLRLLEEAIKIRPSYVDIELAALRGHGYLADEARRNNVKIIASYHDFQGIPEPQQLENLCRESLEHGDLAKVVPMATGFRDNATVLSLYKIFREGRLITFCMGEAGIISRVLCTRLGAPFTYASLDRATAPGQLSIEELRRFYDDVQIP